MKKLYFTDMPLYAVARSILLPGIVSIWSAIVVSLLMCAGDEEILFYPVAGVYVITVLMPRRILCRLPQK